MNLLRIALAPRRCTPVKPLAPALATALLFCALPVSSAPPPISWRELQPGVEFATLRAGKMASGAPGELYVVRVDPARARLTVALASEAGSQPRTAADWCRSARLAVAINVGMFQTDERSNVGYLRHGAHVNNPRWNRDNAVLAFGPADPKAPRQWPIPNVLGVVREK